LSDAFLSSSASFCKGVQINIDNEIERH
jgi:hypothetical protein